MVKAFNVNTHTHIHKRRRHENNNNNNHRESRDDMWRHGTRFPNGKLFAKEIKKRWIRTIQF